MEKAGVSLPVIEVFCQYHQPARYDDELEIRTRATQLTPVRIRFDYEVVRLADGTASASGHSVHAALNQAGRPCRLPDRVLEMLDHRPGQRGTPTVYN
jgi:acyl-CoA thioester hydrolase